MDWLQALIMGVVQGLAEFLPISSSGHLVILKNILGLNLDGAETLQFTVLLHIATVLSTLVILWKEFVPLCASFFTFKNDENTTYVLKILLSCIPVAIVGVFFKDAVEEVFGEGLLVVGICLCVTALLLTFAYMFRTRPFQLAPKGDKPYQPRDISWLDAFVIGCSQALAVLPGLSRSGTTIATGILLGDRRDKVATFSFFMVIIPILGEALLDVKKMFEVSAADAPEAAAVGPVPMIVGFLAAFLIGCVACKWMIELVKKGKLIWFAIYCLAVGVLCIVW